MHKAHKTIWLQVDPEGESCDPEQFDINDAATWCKDQINANDVEYIRADVAQAELHDLRAELAAAKKWRDELLARLDVACEVQIISNTYDRIRAERVFANDDLEYDLFAAGWKSAIASAKGGE